jgi:hypothetical protein
VRAAGIWCARDGGLTVASFWRVYPDQIVGVSLLAIAPLQPTHISLMYRINCRSEPARDGGLIGNGFFAGVHIHFCGYGCYWFRPYAESLSKSAKVTKALLPLSSGASPGLGIPSLRSCSVGPPRSAIHGRARLTRHPCRVAHCAEPALGLPRGQEDQNQKQIKSQSEAAWQPT